MKKIFLLVSLLLVIALRNVRAQDAGLNFQGVARASNGTILTSQKIGLKFSIIALSENGTVEYSEIKIVNTNSQGVFAIVIGDTNVVNSSGNFKNINWKNFPKFLKIEMDPNGGSQFIPMGTVQLQSVPYSFVSNFSNGVNAENINGIIPISQGGTGSNSLDKLKKSLGIDKLDNTADIDKPISNKANTAINEKLNIADTADLMRKNDTIPLSNRIELKTPLIRKITINGTEQNLSEDRSWTIPTFSGDYADLTGSPDLSTYQTNANKSNSITNDSNSVIKYPTVKAVKEYVDSTNTLPNTGITAGTYGSSSTIPVFTVDEKGRLTSSENISLSIDAGTLTGTALHNNITGSSLTSVGVITSGTWSGTTINIANGGTGATTAEAARSNLGLVIGTNVLSPNTPITSATKTKISFDTNGLVTGGADVTTADITISTDRNFVTDAQLGVLSNTSGTNSGDQIITLIGHVTGTGSGTFSTTIADSIITNSMLVGNISDTKLNTISTIGKIANSATTGTSSNTINSLVLRDVNGDFSAGTITGSLSGTASIASSALNIAGGAEGSLPFQSNIGTTTFLARGTDGQFLQLTGGLPTWTSMNLLIDNILTSNENNESLDLIGDEPDFNNLNVYTTNNLKIGNNTLRNLTIGIANIAIGDSSMYFNNEGGANVAIGYKSMFKNVSGNANTAVGTYSLYENISGDFNSAFGNLALSNNTFGRKNSAFGEWALKSNEFGSNNTALGVNSLTSNNGSDNTASGSDALYQNELGSKNTANGRRTLYNNTDGNQNTAIGYKSLFENTIGNENIAIGYEALFYNSQGNRNVAIGDSSLFINSDGSENTAIGHLAGTSSSSLNNTTAIGSGAIVNGSNQIMLGNSLIDTVFTSGKLKLGEITYPNEDGGEGMVLTTDGEGNLSWLLPYFNTSDLSNRIDSITPKSQGDIIYGGVNGLPTILGAGTDGHVLKLSGGFPTWNKPVTNGYTGNIAFIGPNDELLGSSDLFWNNSGKQLGIGTDQPEFPLHINQKENEYGIMLSSPPSSTTNKFGSQIGFRSNVSNSTTTNTGLFQLDEDGNMVFRTLQGGLYFDNFGDGNINFRIRHDNAPNTTGIQMTLDKNGDLSVPGSITTSGTVTANGTILTSDIRLKRKIIPINNAISVINKLNPVSYEKKKNLNTNTYDIKENGFIAQEIQQVLPELVNESNSSDKILSVNYNAIIPILTQGIREQQSEIENLKKELEVLKNIISSKHKGKRKK